MDKRHSINYYYVTFVWLFCLLLSTTIIGAYSFNNCSSIERKALTVFKQGLSDPSARLSSWVGHNCCEWHGITCNPSSGKVTKIDLLNSFRSTISLFIKYGDYLKRSRMNPDVFSQDFFQKTCLRGEISSSLLDLKYLSYLDLSMNNFEGAPIPQFFGMLRSLRYLNLFYANFSGQIPSQLGNLSNLNYLDLSGWNVFAWPKLHVENLEWVSSLSSLEYLNLGGVNLSSVKDSNWIHAFNRLSSLVELHLSECDISSLDPSAAFLNLSSLKVLDLSVNKINSSMSLWLPNLATLDLSFNYFQVTLPRDFMKLKNLQYLDLSSNDNLHKYIGDHPPRFQQNLCKLRFLHLANSCFEVKLEEFLDSLSNCTRSRLESLDLAGNGFVGEIPNSLGTFNNLRFLNLSYNHLWGSLPNSLCNLPLLQHLLIQESFLNGTITESPLMNLTKLEIFKVGTNTKQSLVFNISRDWIPPFMLKNLYLQHCLLGPQFPVWLQTQTQLTELTLNDVGISGSVPNEWLSNICSQIIRLDLSNNAINVSLSHILGAHQNNYVRGSQNLLNDSTSLRYPHLRFLDLRNNQLWGAIPSNINDLMPNLYELYLSRNYLNGTIPSSIKIMSHLQVLSISDNQLSDELFDDWGRLKSLFVIDLANNNLYGKIPTTIGLLTSLNKLMLSNNHLHGKIPKSLQNCSILISLDLSGNSFLYGNLPSWIGLAMPELRLLNLRSNGFSGTIPRQWCNLRFLQIFDLSNNHISGEVPSCFYNFTSFVDSNPNGFIGLGYYRVSVSVSGLRVYYSYEEKTRLVMKGTESEYKNILKLVLTIDLSRNKLSGEIPNEITKLMYLGTLNLSWNALVGTIPKNIGGMKNLQTLDLSHNHLTGRIPASLASLTFLERLKVSFNNLSGRIPTGNQLRTLEDEDPSIYEGNPYLCGSPLPIMCPGDESSSNVPHYSSTSNNEEEDESFEMIGFFISMAIGFPVGINILFFTIFTNQARRIIYFRFVDGVNNNILQTMHFLTISLQRRIVIIWRRNN